MNPELDESLLSQFNGPIVGGAKREQATRAMSVCDTGFRSLEGKSAEDVGADLWEAVRLELVERQQHRKALATHHEQLRVWDERRPENFENRAALVGGKSSGSKSALDAVECPVFRVTGKSKADEAVTESR
jgi:hypothetical protein